MSRSVGNSQQCEAVEIGFLDLKLCWKLVLHHVKHYLHILCENNFFVLFLVGIAVHLPVHGIKASPLGRKYHNTP
jgi:hypothetical protein